MKQHYGNQRRSLQNQSSLDTIIISRYEHLSNSQFDMGREWHAVLDYSGLPNKQSGRFRITSKIVQQTEPTQNKSRKMQIL